MTLILTLTLTQVRTLVAAAEFTGEASMECYKAGPLLGQGAFSKVYTGYHRLTGRKVALKQYDKVKLEKSPVLLAAVRLTLSLTYFNPYPHPNPNPGLLPLTLPNPNFSKTDLMIRRLLLLPHDR